MRIAVVSDIHGNLPALQSVLAEIAREGVDLTVNLGDIASGPLWPRETVALLMTLALPTIAGNHERQALAARPGRDDDDAFTAAELGAAERGWLAALPAALSIDALRLVHGTPASDLHCLMETVTPHCGMRAATADELRERLGAIDGEVLLCGHTHVPRISQLDGRLVVNPGSVGRPAYDHDQPYDHVVETGSPHARWALVERGPHGWQAQLRATAYDHEAAAARAATLGFADWAHQLRTGRVG